MKKDRKAQEKPDSGNLQADRKTHRSTSKPNRKRGPMIYERLPVGIVKSSLQGKYINANEEFCQIVGYEKEQLLALGIKDIIFEKDYPIVIKLYQQLAEGKIPFYKIEKRYVRKNGEIVWVEVKRSLVRNSQGKALYTLGAVLDVTERRTKFTRQQEAFYQFADQLHRIDALEDVFEASLETIITALQCQRASILLFDETGAGHFVGWRGLSDHYRNAMEGHSFWKPEEKNPEPTWLCLDDIGTSDLSDSLKAVFKKEKISSLAIVSLVSHGELIGKLMAYFNKPHTFSVDEIELSLAIARQLTFDIERKRVEESLRENEERHRRIVETANEGIWEIDKEMRTVFVNARMAEMLGYTMEEMIGRPVFEFLFPEDYSEGERRLERAKQGNPARSIEFRYRRKDGSVLWTIGSRTPKLDMQGNFLGSFAMISDITRRKRNEERLHQQAEILEWAQVAIRDMNSRIVLWNKGAEQLYGWTKEEALGKVSHELFKTKFPVSLEDYENKLFSNGEWEGELEQMGRDGRPIIVASYQVIYHDATGEPVAILEVNNDITERKKAEEALRAFNIDLENRVHQRTAELQTANQILQEEIAERKQAEELLRSWAHIFEHADWGIATVLKDTFVMMNPMFAKMHGYRVEELIGHSIYEVLAPESHADTREQIRIAHETGHHIYENKHIRKDGNTFPALVDTFVVRDSQGNVLYRAINVQDITERKQAEEALKESRQHLQRLSRRLVEVQEEERRAIARELHDRVGQNLSALKLNLAMLENQPSQDPVQQSDARLQDSLHLVEETTKLVRDLLTELRPAVLDDYGLKAALQAYIDEFAPRYNINVVLDMAEEPVLRLNPGLEVTLLRIAQEALTNIARHAQADQATLALRRENNTVHLTVLDNGVGMEASQGKPHVSHGLKIMHERAEAFGGTVNIGSFGGKGTKVEAIIPLENVAQNIV
jgi:PAS domain S-box-containing protein